ncbi:MAG: HDOD domain-containing protein [Planctomycetes bacterium]|nr:HDOD domain-containing protein [Planctomycetota bacterium]
MLLLLRHDYWEELNVIDPEERTATLPPPAEAAPETPILSLQGLPGTNEVYVARQAIFDRGLNVYGYEILSRSGWENRFTGENGDAATNQVIDGALHTFGLGTLVGTRLGFINMTRRMLVEEFGFLLPRENTMLEILETVEPDAEVIAACRALKDAGYRLAIDDYTGRPEMDPLVALADVVKVDYRAASAEQRAAYPRMLARRGLLMLAEKVESYAEQREALQAGYQLFQGYFFCRPQVLSRKEIPAYKVNYLRFLREVNRTDVDFPELERILGQDVAMSLKLLRYINSAQFGLRSKIETIRRALIMLGTRPIKAWVSLLALSAMGQDKPHELIVSSLVRSHFCQQLGLAAGMKEHAFDLSMIGMLSSLDAILDRPMPEIVKELPLSEPVKAALIGEPYGLGMVLNLAKAYEMGDWEHCSALANSLTIEDSRVFEIYCQSIAWSNQIFQSTELN